MSSAARRKEKAAEWEAIQRAEMDERFRVQGLSIFELILESSIDENTRIIIERICEHVGLDFYASPPS